MRRAGGHHLDLFAGIELAVDDAHVGDNAAVDVVDRVEDHRPRGGVGIPDRGRDLPDHLVEQFAHADAGLAGNPQHVLGLTADDVRDLTGVPVRVGGGQVDLVEDRDDGEVPVQRPVEVGQRLRFDALRGVDQQDRPLAGLQSARHLVGEVDVAGGVDQMQDVVLFGAVLGSDRPRQPHVLGLDGDPALAFDVHPVQVLGPHVAVGDDAGDAEHPVGQGRFTVVDMRDDAEVPDLRRRSERLVGETTDGNLLVEAR